VLEKHFGFAPHGTAEFAIEFGPRPTAIAEEFATQLLKFLFLFRGEFVLVGIPQFAKASDQPFTIRVRLIFTAEDSARIDNDAVNVSSLEPLAGEISHELFRTVVCQHAFELFFEVWAKLILCGESE
jgi:hypothetical protein